MERKTGKAEVNQQFVRPSRLNVRGSCQRDLEQRQLVQKRDRPLAGVAEHARKEQMPS